MSSYVLAFRGRPDHTSQPGEDAAWGAWFGQLGPAIADFGNGWAPVAPCPSGRATARTGGC
jgi:hypothetical protein